MQPTCRQLLLLYLASRLLACPLLRDTAGLLYPVFFCLLFFPCSSRSSYLRWQTGLALCAQPPLHQLHQPEQHRRSCQRQQCAASLRGGSSNRGRLSDTNPPPRALPPPGELHATVHNFIIIGENGQRGRCVQGSGASQQEVRPRCRLIL